MGANRGPEPYVRTCLGSCSFVLGSLIKGPRPCRTLTAFMHVLIAESYNYFMAILPKEDQGRSNQGLYIVIAYVFFPSDVGV